MKKIFRIPHLPTIISLTVVWLLIILGVYLRANQADVFPADNNDDGLFYAWAGITFWDNPLRPASHSIFESGNPALIWRSQYRDFVPWERFGLKITRPWLDHPPLGAAIIGLPAKLLGYQAFQQIPTLIVRFPALLASIFTMLLTYLLATKLFGGKTGRLSLLFLATVPYFIMAHRQSFLENILTPLFLASWLALLENRPKLAAILSFFCGWIKVPGFAVPFMFALLVKKPLFFITGIASLLAYLAYGYLAGKDAFLYILSQQGNRGAFVRSFYDTLTKPHFYGGFEDGWYVLGFMLIIWMLTKFKQEKFKTYNFFLAMWLIVLFLVTGRMNNSPWYYYPLIPFLAINLGFYANQALQLNNLFLILPFWLLGLTGFDLLRIDLQSIWLRVATVLFFLPFVLSLKKLSFWLTRILLIFLILLNIYAAIHYPEIYCKYEKCPKPVKISLSYD
jgi:hypothetical protein